MSNFKVKVKGRFWTIKVKDVMGVHRDEVYTYVGKNLFNSKIVKWVRITK